MVKGYVGEIFNSIQGEGFHVGRRQLFVRLAGCTWNCVYCDSVRFRDFRPALCRIERKPGTGKFMNIRNPLSTEEVLVHLRRLRTPDVHSISITGGEPLLAGEFLVELARVCGREGFRTYLETNGCSSSMMGKVLPYIDIAAVDIKLPDHRAVPAGEWKKIFMEEIECIKLAVKKSVEVFVKIVVLGSTADADLRRVFSKISDSGVPVVLQPVTAVGRVRPPSFKRLFRISEMASRSGIKEIAIIPQLHKLMGVH